MLGTVRGRPPAPPEPQYRRAAEAINAKVGQFLVGPVNFLPRALAFDVDPAAIREVARVLRGRRVARGVPVRAATDADRRSALIGGPSSAGYGGAGGRRQRILLDERAAQCPRRARAGRA